MSGGLANGFFASKDKQEDKFDKQNRNCVFKITLNSSHFKRIKDH